MKTGVQSIAKGLKTLDSGFRRNDVKKNEINFFTPSGRDRVGAKMGFFHSFINRKGNCLRSWISILMISGGSASRPYLPLNQEAFR